MAKPDLAAQWLRAKRAEKPRRKRRGKEGVSCFVENRIAYEPPDVLALARLALEATPQKQRLKRRYDRVPRGMEYLRANVGFCGDECLYYPHVPPGGSTHATWGDATMPLAAAMCQLAHGPKEEGQVCRHKCGNGHLSCVNPVHLCWGMPADNGHDYHLHIGRPEGWPVVVPHIPPEVIDYVRASGKLINVLAVELGIHAAVLRTLR